MLTVSLHGIKLHAPHGLYPQEHILGNAFEVDIDVFAADATAAGEWPFIDYTSIQQAVADTFLKEDKLLENFVRNIHQALSAQFPEATKIRVAVRKLAPPMPGEIAYAQVCFEG